MKIIEVWTSAKNAVGIQVAKKNVGQWKSILKGNL